MDVPTNTIELVTYFEGFYSRPYLCPARVPTIGYGSTRYPNSKRVTLKDPPITKDQAIKIMEHELEGCVISTIRQCPILLTVNSNYLGAVVDFVYNLGVGSFSSSTLKRKINASLWNEVPLQLNKWVYGGGKKLRGLVLRRQAEAAYFT
jgi:lysozyme